MGPFFVIYQLRDTKEWNICVDHEGQPRFFDSSIEADRAGTDVAKDLEHHGIPARYFVSRLHSAIANPTT